MVDGTCVGRARVPWKHPRYHGSMTRIVGNLNRTEFILDPVQALRRGRVLDAMLAGAQPRRTPGVTRATHRTMNALDDQRQLEAARRLNPKPW